MKNLLRNSLFISLLILVIACNEKEAQKNLAKAAIHRTRENLVSANIITDSSGKVITIPLLAFSHRDDHLVLMDVPDTTEASKNKTLFIGLGNPGDRSTIKIQINSNFQITIKKNPGDEASLILYKGERPEQKAPFPKYIVDEQDALIYQWKDKGHKHLALYAIIRLDHGYSFLVESIEPSQEATEYTEEDMRTMLKSARSLRLNEVKS